MWGLTPKISEHARERCEQMGISTKVPKRIWRHRTLTRPDPQGHDGTRFVWSEVEPAYAAIINIEADPPLVCTVLYFTPDAPFVRPEPSG